MANVSDSSHTTSSDNDSDRPRTLPLAAAPRSRANTRHSFTAPSRIPKLRTTSVSQPQAPVSPPRTPADRDTAPAALDWGLGGEWSALVGETKRSGSEVEAEAVVDDDIVEPVEVSENADSPPQQPAVVSSGPFDNFEHDAANLERPFDSVAPKEVSDDDYEPLIVFEDVDQQGGEGEGEFHGGGVLDGDSSDGVASQSSDSEHFDLRTTRALREHHSAAESSSGVSNDEKFPVVSMWTESEQHTIRQDGPRDTDKQETDPSDADGPRNSGSDSDLHVVPDTTQPGETDRLEKASDDEQHAVVSGSEDVDQHSSEQHDLLETAVQDSDISGAEASEPFDSDFDIKTAPAPRQLHITGRLEPFVDNEQHPVVSASKGVDQHTDIQETGLSDADVSHTTDSDVSDMQLPPARIRGPFLTTAERERTAENRATVSPQLVLRGLIRDARPEMIHFTLPHSLFSPDDLRKGLQYAYSMLQVATSKLAILELLENETTNMTGSDLRRWIELSDDLNPRGRAEARISVIFESLSIGEMKAALEELVQSRLVVEGQLEKTQTSLMGRAVAKERHEKSMVIPGKRVANFDKKGDGSTKKRRVSKEDNETAFDAFLTAIMVVLIGALYLYIREYPVGSAGGWTNMKT